MLRVAITSNFTLVLLLQLELAGSLKSKPAEKRHKLTPPLPEREKLSTGKPWTPISGETECWITSIVRIKVQNASDSPYKTNKLF